MFTVRKATPAKSVMFVVTYDDNRTAYLWIAASTAGDQEIAAVARARQEQGALPLGKIASIRRVR